MNKKHSQLSTIDSRIRDAYVLARSGEFLGIDQDSDPSLLVRATSDFAGNVIGMRQIMVTPDKADQWLKHNTGNRPIRLWWVNALAGMIRREYWMCTHQGIAFSESGHLLDGQHRLLAIKQSNTTVPVCVFWNVPVDAFKVLDAGVKRSIADLTGLPKRTAEAARLAAEIAFSERADKGSAGSVLEIANAGIEELHERLVDGARTAIKYYGSASFRVAAMALVMDGHPEEYVFNVYRNLINFEVDELPAIAKNLIKQVNQGSVSAMEKSDALTRALKVMSPEYRDIKRLQVSEHEKTESLKRVRNILMRAMGKD